MTSTTALPTSPSTTGTPAAPTVAWSLADLAADTATAARPLALGPVARPASVRVIGRPVGRTTGRARRRSTAVGLGGLVATVALVALAGPAAATDGGGFTGMSGDGVHGDLYAPPTTAAWDPALPTVWLVPGPVETDQVATGPCPGDRVEVDQTDHALLLRDGDLSQDLWVAVDQSAYGEYDDRYETTWVLLPAGDDQVEVPLVALGRGRTASESHWTLWVNGTDTYQVTEDPFRPSVIEIDALDDAGTDGRSTDSCVQIGSGITVTNDLSNELSSDVIASSNSTHEVVVSIDDRGMANPSGTVQVGTPERPRTTPADQRPADDAQGDSGNEAPAPVALGVLGLGGLGGLAALIRRVVR